MKTSTLASAFSIILTSLAAVFHAGADQIILVPTGTTNTAGILANGGSDTVLVENNAAVWVSATGVAGVTAVNPDGGTNLVGNHGLIRADGTIPESTNADLTVTALSTGGGTTTVTNANSIQATATIGDEPVGGTNLVTAHSTSTGIAAGGNDSISNSGSIGAFATNELARKTPLVLFGLGLDFGTNSTTAVATSTGVSGGGSPVSFTSDGTLTAHAEARIFPFELELTLEDAASADASMNAIANATGIEGGAGSSGITNNGLITVSAHGIAGSTSVNSTIANAASSDTSINATANATGIAGGNGTSTIHNADQIISTALAEAQTVNVSLSFDSVAKADAMLTPVANASGITGGGADDRITNDGNIAANATADATRVGVSAMLYDFTALQELLDASADNTTKASATVVGVDGGFGNDLMTNLGSISATATSKVVAVDVALSSIGVPAVSQVTNVIFGHSLATMDRFAETGATGMAGGSGNDTLLNAGSLKAAATSESTVTSVNVGVSLPVELPLGFLPGIPVATAGSSNTSIAIGMDGGDGSDSIRNTGFMDTSADAETLGIVGSLNLAFTVEGAGIGIPIADATTSANSLATGIAGGMGSDIILNEAGATNNVGSLAHANSWLVSADIKCAVEGLDIGIPMATAAVLSEATATGMSGGDGDDIVRNEGRLSTTATAEADNHVASLKVTGVAAGVAAGLTVTDASTTGQATGTGMMGDAGNDEIINAETGTNSVAANSDVQSLGIAVSVIGPTEGLAVALGKVDANTKAEAEATGIQGGDGTNFIHNAGLTEANATATNLNIAVGAGVTVTLDTGVGIAGAQVGADSEARVESTGIAVGDGGSLVVNDGTVRAVSDTRAQTVSVAVTANIGIGAGFLDTDATSVANSTSKGIRGGSGNDFITNSSTGNVDATASSSVSSASAGINLSIAGIGLTDASAFATNRAAGIDAGSGHDMVSNEGHVAATADADLKSLAITFGGLIGGSWGTAETTADATAVGIDGGAGVNQLSNTGTLDALANGHLTATAISITGEGYSQADASSTARAESVGINAGDDGNMILNAGNIRADSATEAKSTSVTVTVGAGGINADASCVAESIATGIQTGAGNDVITNSATGNIVTGAASTNRAASAGVHVVGLGGGLADASAAATNLATGISAGGGQDTVRNEGNVTVLANAKGNATSFTFGGLVGGGVAKAGTTAEAVGVGIEGGTGSDQLSNSGLLDVRATTDLDASSISITGTGYASADARATSQAIADGMMGGGEDDFVSNTGVVRVNIVSAVDVTSKSFTLVGYSSAKVIETMAEAMATGLGGGDGNDVLINDGMLSVTLADGQPMANAVGHSSSWNLIGVAAADVTLSANVMATGMAGGEGNDTLLNRGTNIVGGGLSGPSMAEVDASGSSWTFGGSARSGTVASAEATSTGLSGDNGDDWLRNEGVLEVNATSHLHSGNGASATFGSSATTAKVTASSSATGLAGGEGDDQMFNAGALTVNSSARTQTRCTADTGWLYGNGNSQSDAQSTAAAFGASLGDGQNLFNNTNQIAVLSTAHANSYAGGDGADIWDGDASSRTSSMVTNQAAGITSGDGTNSISNSGTILVVTRKADGDAAMAVATSKADGDGLDGDGWAKAVAVVDATSTGVEVGHGLFAIWNSGDIMVTAEPTASASVSVDGDNTGNATGITLSTASGEAVGIRIGNGDGQISNSGDLVVTAKATANDAASIAGGWLGSDISSRSLAASAQAIGITTGDGTHQITNCGTIMVQAEAGSNNGHAALSTSAVGIQTGGGDDTIVNCGTLSATTKTGSASGIGVAIDSGLGDDSVRLDDGSSTIGRVELGGGDDELILAGTPEITGALHGDSGTDTLVLDGAGSYGFSEASTLSGFERALKFNDGIFTLWRGLFTVERLEVTGGTLELHGDYTFQGAGGDGAPDGYFGSVVNGDGSAGQLLVLGQAYLDGDITVDRGPGPFAIGLTPFDVIEATNGIANSFISTNLPAARTLLSFGLNQLDDRVQVEALGLSFTTVAHNPVELAVANYLDQILVPGDTNDLGHVLDIMQQLNEPDFATAFSSLSPDSYDAYTRATYATVWQHSKSMQQRLMTLRSAAGHRPASQDSAARAFFKPVLLASADGDLGEVMRQEQQRAMQEPNGIWADVFGQWSDQDGKDGYTGFTYDVWGMTAGYDRQLNGRLTLGLSAAYAATDVSLDESRGSGDIESYSGSIYGSYALEKLHFEGVASYGHNRYENQRVVIIDSINRLANSDHDGQALGVFFSGGYACEWKRWTLEPFASLQYTHLDEDAFSETGAGGVDLLMAGRETGSLVSELGLRVGRVFPREHFTCVPEVSVAWNYDYDIDDRVMTASLAGAPGTAFSLRGQNVDQNGITAGAGLTLLFKKGFSTSVRYQGEFRDGYAGHAAVGELRFSF